MGCRLGVTLFDLEAGVFFGKTWHSPKLIPVITNLDGNDSESPNEDTDIDTHRANLVGNKLVMHLKNQCVYFHTHTKSAHVVAVVEINFESF